MKVFTIWHWRIPVALFPVHAHWISPVSSKNKRLGFTPVLQDPSNQFNSFPSGLPGPPVGPLGVSEITQHTCLLSWHPPRYDGGLKITHYVVERRDTKSNHWICISTTCKDTNFHVQGLTEGNEYIFRVMAVNENGMGPPLEGTNPVIAKSPFSKSYLPLDFQLYHLWSDSNELSSFQTNHRSLAYRTSPKWAVTSWTYSGRNQKTTEALVSKATGSRSTKLAPKHGNVSVLHYAFRLK